MCPPKKKIRWFRWMLIGMAISLPLLCVLYRITTESQIERELDKIRAAGYPVTCAELDMWYTSVPLEENGAEVVLNAYDCIVIWEEKGTPFENGVSAEMAELAKAYGFTDIEITDAPSDSFDEDWQVKNKDLLPIINSELKRPERTSNISEGMKAVISDYLDDNSKALEILHTTTEYTKSRYPVNLNSGIKAFMPDLKEIKIIAKTLMLEAVLCSESNQPDKAVESFRTAIAVSRTLNNEPVLISYLVKMGCDRNAIRSLEYMFNHSEFNSEQLGTIDQTIADIITHSNIKRAFIGERCFGINCFSNPKSVGIPTPVVAIKFTGIMNNDFLVYLDLMDRRINAIDLPLPQSKKAFNQINSDVNALPWYCVFTKTVMPALDRVIGIHYRYLTFFRIARTATAIEKYRLAHDNKIPGKLSDLVPGYLEEIAIDPFDLKPIRYIKLEKGYSLYSIGIDQVDNGGTEFDDKGRRGQKGTDITFIVEK